MMCFTPNLRVLTLFDSHTTTHSLEIVSNSLTYIVFPRSLLTLILFVTIALYICSVPVLALLAPWARFLRRPLTSIQTLTKKGKGYNEITIY